MKVLVICALSLLGLVGISSDVKAGCDGTGLFGVRGRVQARQTNRQIERAGSSLGSVITSTTTTRSTAASSYRIVGVPLGACPNGSCPLPQKALPMDPMKK